MVKRITLAVVAVSMIAILGWGLYLGYAIIAGSEIDLLKTESEDLKNSYKLLNLTFIELTESYNNLSDRYGELSANYSQESVFARFILLFELSIPGKPLYRSVSVIKLREHGRELGTVTSVFSVSELNVDIVNVALTVSFASADFLEGVGLRLSHFVGVFETIPPPVLPIPSTSVYGLSSGEQIILANVTSNISGMDMPAVAIGYSISDVELRFANGSTTLLDSFSEGRCRVTRQATLDSVNGLIESIAPLWEGDYQYPPSLKLRHLKTLNGMHLWREIVINVDDGSHPFFRGTYTVAVIASCRWPT